MASTELIICEAAFAYLNIVYFFSSGNYETIKAIFENSYFGKTKHCKKEYLERAIKKIQKDTKVYTKANKPGVYNIGKKKKKLVIKGARFFSKSFRYLL